MFVPPLVTWSQQHSPNVRKAATTLAHTIMRITLTLFHASAGQPSNTVFDDASAYGTAKH